MDLDYLSSTLKGVRVMAAQQTVNLAVACIRQFMHAYPSVCETFHYVYFEHSNAPEEQMPDLHEFLSGFPLFRLPAVFTGTDHAYLKNSSEYPLNLAIVVYAESRERIFDLKLMKKYMQRYNVLQAKLRSIAYTRNLLVAACWRACFIDAFRAADFDLTLNSTRLLHVVETALIRNSSGVAHLYVSTAVTMCAATLNQQFSQREYDMMFMLVRERLGLSESTSLAALNRID